MVRRWLGTDRAATVAGASFVLPAAAIRGMQVQVRITHRLITTIPMQTIVLCSGQRVVLGPAGQKERAVGEHDGNNDAIAPHPRRRLDTIEIDLRALDRVGIDELLGSVPDCHDAWYSTALGRAAREADERGDIRLGDALFVLKEAMSPMLNSASVTQPFKPVLETGMGRSALPSDFTDDQIAAFAELFPRLQHPDLRARVADIVFLRSKGRRRYEPALAAVAAYIDAAYIRLAGAKHLRLAETRVERALRLSKAVNGRDGDSHRAACNLAARASSAFFDGRRHASFRRMQPLLREFGIADPTGAAEQCEDAARRAVEDGYGNVAVNLHNEASAWRKAAGDVVGARRAAVAAAEMVVRRAEAEATRGNFMAACVHLEGAITAYRTIRKSPERDQRIEQLLARLRELQPRLIDHMQTFTMEVPVNELRRGGKDAVRDHGLVDAVIRLAHIFDLPSSEGLTAEVREAARDAPLFHMVHRVSIDKEGKTKARTGGIAAEDVKEAAAGLRYRIIERANQHQMVATVSIEAARAVIAAEHDIDTEVMLTLARESTFIPSGRERLWARALSAGFAGDFVVALHLLLPQVEHALRVRLKERGVDAAGFDHRTGLQEDWTLNQILYHPVCAEMLGEETMLDLQALLTEKGGTNLRNEAMHGLLDDETVDGWPARYLWWMALRLCVLGLPLQDGVVGTASAPGADSP